MLPKKKEAGPTGFLSQPPRLPAPACPLCSRVSTAPFCQTESLSPLDSQGDQNPWGPWPGRAAPGPTQCRGPPGG